MPVPLAAFATCTDMFCRDLSKVLTDTPERSAAWRMPARASVVTPSLSAVLAKLSIAAMRILTSAAVAPSAAPANAAPIFATFLTVSPTLLRTPAILDFKDLNARAVLSCAKISTFTFFAIFVLQLEPSAPAHKLAHIHLVYFADRLPKQLC